MSKHYATSSIIEEGAVIGDNVMIGYFCHVSKDVVIGNDVKIGNGTSFTGLETRTHRKREGDNRTIIEDGVTIGSNVTVAGNTRIGREAVVADGSTVIGYVWPHSFVAGNPARKIYSLSAIA